MDIRPISTRADYEEALTELRRLMKAPTGTPDSDKLEVLGVLVEAYEKEAFPLDAPDPIEAITFRMEQQGLTRKDLLPVFGTTARVSEVLGGKRPLTLEMIRKLHELFDIPLESLITARKTTGHTRRKEGGRRPAARRDRPMRTRRTGEAAR